MRRIKASALRRNREARGLTREELADMTDVFSGHIGKMERGEVERTSPAVISRLARALGVAGEEIAYPSDFSEAETWAMANNKSLSYTLELAADGRLEGAYQDQKGIWHIEQDASVLPPTARSRERWRERWDKWDRDRQRRRRARARELAEG